jgi:hypothetical protein
MAPHHLNSRIKHVFSEGYQIGLLAEKTNSIIMTKRRRINFLTMLALFSSFVLLAPSLLSLLPSLLQGATAQMPPEECNKCIVIEYEGGQSAEISGVESFANLTTRQLLDLPEKHTIYQNNES